ncbi:hypothetical protein ACUUL3_09255 [Thiovibrio sp. JS02]
MPPGFIRGEGGGRAAPAAGGGQAVMAGTGEEVREPVVFRARKGEKIRGPVGSGRLVQGAEFLNQQHSGGKFHSEVKRTLHEDLDGSSLGHGFTFLGSGFIPLYSGRLLISSVFFSGIFMK